MNTYHYMIYRTGWCCDCGAGLDADFACNKRYDGTHCFHWRKGKDELELMDSLGDEEVNHERCKDARRVHLALSSRRVW